MQMYRYYLSVFGVVTCLLWSSAAFAVADLAVQISEDGKPIEGATISLVSLQPPDDANVDKEKEVQEEVVIIDQAEDDDDDGVVVIPVKNEGEYKVLIALPGQKPQEVFVQIPAEGVVNIAPKDGVFAVLNNAPPSTKNNTDTAQACPEPAAHDAIIVGDNSAVGSQAQLVEKVSETVGGALGNLLGGGGSFGFGSPRGDRGRASNMGRQMRGKNRAQSAGPEVLDDPIGEREKTFIKDASTGSSIKVGGRMRKDSVLISSSIIDADDGTFQTVFLEDSNGRRMRPIGYFIYELYFDWKLTVSWTRDKYVNGQHVSHEEGGWQESGRELVSRTRKNVMAEDEGPIWKRLGFGNAVKGIKDLGTVFPITPDQLAEGPVSVVIHTTRPDEDPVTTTPFIYTMTLRRGEIVLEPARRTLASADCP